MGNSVIPGLPRQGRRIKMFKSILNFLDVPGLLEIVFKENKTKNKTNQNKNHCNTNRQTGTSRIQKPTLMYMLG